MKKLLQKILTFRQRNGKLRSKRSVNRKGVAFGFTLIELLVASLIASLLVVVMMTFLVGVLDSDRKESAKSNAQEELQAAISYISDDLQEAIYIYGADGLAAINSELPHMQSVSNTSECSPTSNTCTPILVFWKRFSYEPLATAKYSSTGASQIIGCMPYANPTNCVSSSATLNPYQTAFGRSSYTYSLVAYYLKNDSANTGNTWSNTARILRWELRDGYVAYCSTGSAITNVSGTITSPTGCPAAANISTRANSTLITTPIPLVDPNPYFILPSQGFNRPDFASVGTLTALASTWKKFANFDLSSTGSPFVSLVDYMDDTDYNANQGGNNNAGTASTATAAIKIPIGKNIAVPTGVTQATTYNPDCDDPSVGVGNVNPASTTNLTGNITQRVPADFTSATANPAGLSSFYACIAPESVTARIFLRGNAIARVGSPPAAKNFRLANTNNITFFPTADVRSFGRSAIGLKKK